MTLQSEDITEITAAMVKVQGEMGPAIKGKVNPFFKSSYATLGDVWESCRDVLQANGIAVIQGARLVDGKACMETKLVHISGQWFSSLWEMMPAKEDPQSMGSAITYMRRYSLSAMVGILAEDDDGNAASRTPAKMEANRAKADNVAAKHVGNYLDKDVANLPRNKQEWQEWFVMFKVVIDGCKSVGQLDTCEKSAAGILDAAFKASAVFHAGVIDYIQGRRDILETPTRDTPNTELGAG